MSSKTDSITVYTNHCPACNILVSLLEKKDIPYSLIDNEDEVKAAAASANTDQVPLCRIPGETTLKLFPEMLGYINSL